MEKRCVIGIDFGTESGRAVLVDAADGQELAFHVTRYPHGVIDEALPVSGKRLGPNWALQHPDDYVEVLRRSVPEVLRIAGVPPAWVIGIGIDFTACTVMPVDAEGTPLCMLETYADEPHAYVKLWKHHAAQAEADMLNEIAAQRGEVFLRRYGGKTSSEWMIAKVWQVLREAPEIYEAADMFVEAADWIVRVMTGSLARSSCCAGYKALWHKADGYPSADFFHALDPRLRQIAETKLRGNVVSLGAKAGELSAHAADMMGLLPGTAVAVGLIDAHAGAVGTGAVKPGQMAMAMGTSLCHMLLSDREVHVEGICGVVRDGIVPGLFGYEAGQPAVGDMFGWFVEHAVPGQLQREAGAANLGVHALLENRASRLKPGEHGLLALDWWNGNRSVLVNSELSGLIVGLTLHTKPEEIYRALLEAAAFGTRRIIETFEEAGVKVNELFACGGLPGRNQLLMQIYADVLGREIKLPGSEQTTALGAAMFGAVAAGSERGGYSNIAEAAAKMVRLREQTYRPIPEHKIVYDEIYGEYVKLHDIFGRREDRLMRKLKELSARIRTAE
ncbi:ribulokinase [Paenibacillus hamazuiensis]|uniref:ribulokinase n=1 Tax=Paenibacillus hamazuiensis TaxID=2936508 RepID=UPI00200C5292